MHVKCKILSDTLYLYRILTFLTPCFSAKSNVHRSSSLKHHVNSYSWSREYSSQWKNYTYIMASSHSQVCELSKTISEWSFSPNTLSSLPMDTIQENYVRRYVENAIFSHVCPTPLESKLQLVAASDNALINILDMDPAIANTDEFIEFVAGNKILSSSIPLAHRYGGHQFGVWASQLGDGRAILLGEYKNRAGQRWELQLKGSGLTPYSRGGDGRAVLRSSVREFLCAEAMHYLGVPTSRVAALVTSNDGVVRDPHYSGQPILERASVVLRLSPTWFRIGSLEILARLREVDSLRVLVTYVLETIFPDIWEEAEHKLGEAAVKMGSRVARLVYQTWVHWQRVGFTHGVLNSDNVSLLGVTIDYGPFGFLSAFNPRYVPNSSDSEARYCYEGQLEAVYFDLEKLRSCLEFLIMSCTGEEAEERGELVQRMAREFREARQQAEADLDRMFLAKLGLREPSPENLRLPKLLLLAMEEQKTDFTATFRQLGEIKSSLLRDSVEVKKHWALEQVSRSVLWSQFVDLYISALAAEGSSEEERALSMAKENPCYILRNWMAQAAIEKAEKDDFSEVRRLERILQEPYKRQEEADGLGYAGKPPAWEEKLKVSCSS